jgi:predicted enzyme related to lactoylglutathione lyase
MFVGPEGPLGAAVENRSAVPHWLAYVSVPSVDAAVDAAVGKGAKVLTPPTDIPNAGRHAALEDPQGAAFAVHTSLREPSAEREPSQGEFSWHELATTVDPAEIFPFYADLFGWEEIRRHDLGAPMGTYLIFGRNGRELGGIFNKGEMGQPGPAYWVCYVSVPDLDDAIEQAKNRRGSVLNGPSDVPGGDRIVQLMDPHGAFFAMHWSPRGAAAAPAAKRAAKRKAPAKPSTKSAPKAAKKRAAEKPARKKAGKTLAKKATKKTAKKTTKKVAKKAAKKKVAKRKGKSAKARGKRR